MSTLWVNKYRPTTLDEYVFANGSVRNTVESWIKNQSIPMIMMCGPCGTGKTSLALLILKLIGTDESDIKIINASIDNGVDFIRNTIVNFSSVMPYGDYKYIILDECDYLSVNAQAALRGVMEKFSETTRFIFTCNYPHKIIPALHSRCQELRIDMIDRTEFMVKIAKILINEGVEFDEATLEHYVNAAYPDMRKCINNCQMHSSTGTLEISVNLSSVADYKVDSIALIRDGKYTEARTLICKNISNEEYDEMYRFMYENVVIWADTDEKVGKCVRAIRDGIVYDTSVSDREINLSATLVTLELITKGVL
jgi:replication factor C small subunit